ncbi:MAG UNVERIFIED_CONTAM: single-stranded DNA-binding protein [Microcystis novacekii LVE1205-3]|jgi:single-strand DNA-binding protein
MAGGYNRIVMVGNLTRDPELKTLPSGQGVCRLNLASNRQFKNRQSGDMVQEVCYVDIDVWGPQADSCSQYLQKGRQVLIEGRLKLDSWQDQEGNNRSKHSIVADRVVFLSSGNNVEVINEKLRR